MLILIVPLLWQDGCGKKFNWATAPSYEIGAEEKFLPPSFQSCMDNVIAMIQKFILFLCVNLYDFRHYQFV